MPNDNYNNYIAYLDFITGKLDGFFEQQKAYIFCKAGCSLCCKNAQFPYSKVEMETLLTGYSKLNNETKEKINANIKTILAAKRNFEGERFLYDCPFLIDNACSCYEYRGIVCRSFGLMSIPDSKHQKTQVPFCCFKGLNYSNVMDEKTNMISSEKYKTTGIKEEPVSFNVSYEFLTNQDFEEAFKFSFGEKKPLIDWFKEEDEQQKER